MSERNDWALDLARQLFDAEVAAWKAVFRNTPIPPFHAVQARASIIRSALTSFVPGEVEKVALLLEGCFLSDAATLLRRQEMALAEAHDVLRALYANKQDNHAWNKLSEIVARIDPAFWEAER